MDVTTRERSGAAETSGAGRTATCRFCDAALQHTFVDLGMSPLANEYVAPDDVAGPETFYPLHAFVCSECLLVQLEEVATPETIFSDYAYFSSYSDSWLRHSERYVESITGRLDLDHGSHVVEVASNDGYLLQFFVERDVPVLGIEPAANVAEVAEGRGIPTLVEFFGEELGRKLAEEGRGADLLVGNNVLAHVPDLNDFVAGIREILEPRGVATLEFPHLVRLIEENQFDTIYHEHFSYFSFHTVERVFAAHGLVLFDVEEVPTHGGSLRIYARHEEDDTRPVTDRVRELRAREEAGGYHELERYLSFEEKVRTTKRNLLDFLIRAKDEGKSIAGYGAAAKGNTLLNYCGIRTDFLDYVADRSPHKQDHLTPGTHIPIRAPEHVAETRPDVVLILPWNLKDEITSAMSHVREWGGEFVVPIPEVTVVR